MHSQNDYESQASEISDVVGDYLLDGELWATLTDAQRYCLSEIALNTSASFERIVELWEASGLTY